VLLIPRKLCIIYAGLNNWLVGSIMRDYIALKLTLPKVGLRDTQVLKVTGVHIMRSSSLNLTKEALEELFGNKYGREAAAMGWGSRIRRRFGYFTPDDYYEATVSKLVTAGCAWLDVGSGRNVFPSNRKLAQSLAQRCSLLVGLDPDSTIEENDLVHERVRVSIENYRSEHTFDVVTLRMVAEHMADPEGVVTALARLTKPGGKVIVYTINRWSPVPIVTYLVPFRFHHLPKRLLWNSNRRDTFPVVYRMNTRSALGQVFGRHGFQESEFGYLDDCRTFAAFRVMLILELCLWRGLHFLGLRYPENCLLSVYRRV
jgi:2-polyprenyl-3-methyl-5-hydroxy-6-metoxy-1,4-benzoquinol methylase